MRKRLIACFLCLAAFSACTISCHAEPNEYNWYTKRTKDHTQPLLDPQLSFIEKHNAVYLDHSNASKSLYLTFDVGYENGNTEKILNILKEENVPGAFFVLSHFVVQNKDLVARMQNEGHLVCNHTAKHKNMTKLSKEEFAKELQTMENLLNEKTEKPIAKFYRPPRGTFNEDNLIWANELGYRTVFWSLCYADWDNAKQPSPVYAKDLLLKYTHPGAIILLHPTSSTNAEILQDLIHSWKADGYTFGKLSDI